ncbi:MAG: Branched-chain-amino-acid transaminase, partial [Bacteroidota bacterium]
LIYYTEKHGVSESTRSNLFYVKNGEVFTPDTHILEGITRMKVLEIARADHPVHVQRCTLDDFLSADEVFTTGSTKRVVPILSIDGKKIGSGERGPVARDLYDELVKLE